MKLLLEAVDGSGFKAGLAYQPMIMTLGFPAKFKERALDLLTIMKINVDAGAMVKNGWRGRFDVSIDYKSMQYAIDRMEDSGQFSFRRVKGFRRFMR